MRTSRHEHLQEETHQRLLRSGDPFDDQVAAVRMLCGSSIILCTAPMLSNPGLDSCAIPDLAPVEHTAADEASKIDSFEFMVRAGLELDSERFKVQSSRRDVLILIGKPGRRGADPR